MLAPAPATLAPLLPALALVLPPLAEPAALALDSGEELQAVTSAKQAIMVGLAQRKDSRRVLMFAP